MWDKERKKGGKKKRRELERGEREERRNDILKHFKSFIGAKSHLSIVIELFSLLYTHWYYNLKEDMKQGNTKKTQTASSKIPVL